MERIPDLNMILIILSFFFNSTLKASGRCVEAFDADARQVSATTPTPETLTPTENLTAYLSDLLERQIIGETELSRFISALERGETVNPINDRDTSVSAPALIHREGIDRYLTSSELDQVALLHWAENSLELEKSVMAKRDTVRQYSKTFHQRIEFYPVPPGRFQPFKNINLSATFSHEVEVMSTLVTQFHWVEIMGENPAQFSDGKNQIGVRVNGRTVTLSPDYPVESITWWSALWFANELSKMYGLTPVYDFKNIVWKSGTKPEDGTLVADSGEVILNAPDGNYYKAEGYRLPTVAEQEYLLFAAGSADGKYYFGNNDSALGDHAWYYANSNNMPHKVAQLKPLILSSSSFYDLLGNVGEWTWDLHKNKLITGADPLGITNTIARSFRGGSWKSGIEYCQYGQAHNVWIDQRYDVVGFRLWRTIK